MGQTHRATEVLKYSALQILCKILRQQKVPRYQDSGLKSWQCQMTLMHLAADMSCQCMSGCQGLLTLATGAFAVVFVTSTLSAFWAIYTVLKTKGSCVESHDSHNISHKYGLKVLLGLINNIYYVIGLHLLSLQQQNADRKMSWEWLLMKIMQKIILCTPGKKKKSPSGLLGLCTNQISPPKTWLYFPPNWFVLFSVISFTTMLVQVFL